MVVLRTTRVAEDYLTLIWKAGEWPDDGRHPTTSGLATALGVTPSTVSANLKRLAREGLIRYEPYGAIELTTDGEQIARDVVRRHRILETFLVEHLDMAWDEIHDEADQLEHAASDRLIDRMDAILGRPATDPHGDPIPREGTPTMAPAVVLASRAAGDRVRIVRVSDINPDILRFLADHQIVLGTTMRVVTPMSATGLMAARREGDQDGHLIELSDPIASAIHVTVVA